MSLSRSLETAAQRESVSRKRPSWPNAWHDLEMGLDAGLEVFPRVRRTHTELSEPIPVVVIHRRDSAIWGLRNWVHADPFVHSKKCLRPTLVPHPSLLPPFLICALAVTLGPSPTLDSLSDLPTPWPNPAALNSSFAHAASSVPSGRAPARNFPAHERMTTSPYNSGATRPCSPARGASQRRTKRATSSAQQDRGRLRCGRDRCSRASSAIFSRG